MPETEIMEFGIKRENEERRDGGCAVVYDPETQRYAVGLQTDNGCYRLFSGGVDAGEGIEEGILREVREESGLFDFLHVEKIAEAKTHYYNSLKNVNRVAHATCFLVILKTAEVHGTQLEEHEKFTLAWDTAPAVLENWSSRNQKEDYSHWIYFMKKCITRINELGYNVNTANTNW